jgi:CelD/BcsL family acetyltransferase involved in cellulose biosynthesis
MKADITKTATRWEDYLKTRIKAKIKNDTFRQEKRFQELGELKFVIARRESEIREITEAMIRQKGRRYQETGARNMFNLQYYQDFYHTLAAAFPGTHVVEDLHVHVSALYLDEAIIATHWGLNFRGVFYYLMPTYEGGEMAKYSAGRIHLLKLLEWSFRNGIKIFDFTIGGETYKKDWCNAELKLYEYYLPVSAKARVLFKLLNFLKDLKQKKKEHGHSK